MTSPRKPASSEQGRKPHPFKSRRDPGLAPLASGAAGSLGGIPSATVTGHYLRESICDEPGCGRPEIDPIHEAPED